MDKIILYWLGVLTALVFLTAATFFFSVLFYHLAEKAAGDILRYRRLSWLRYWAHRCETEGLLRIDHHYRNISLGRRPTTPQEAYEWEASVKDDAP